MLLTTGGVQSQNFLEKAIKQLPAELIWDQAPHSAFTDMVYFKGKFYCTFREGEGHTPVKSGVDGAIRVISATDGSHWQSQTLIEVPHYDLRDPKISVTPDNRLMVLMGAADYQGSNVEGRKGLVSFSSDGLSFTEPVAVSIDSSISNEKDWLWRVNWHRDTGYGVVYQNDQDASKAYLVKTTDGMVYQLVTDLGIEGRPNEATIKVKEDGQMIMIIRRESDNKHGLMGTSSPPYKHWEWQDTGVRLGGPDFVVLPNNQLLLGSRVYGEGGHSTGLFINQPNGQFKLLAELPSGGDTSYPGMVLMDDTLYMSYYSGHQEKTAIYFASVRLKQLRIKD